MKRTCITPLLALILCSGPHLMSGQAPEVPDWALPGSATHSQVPPPKGFHRPSRTFDAPIGIFEAQTDVGGPLLPGSATYDAATRRYTITSASYNIWYSRDEFRYLWRRMSGDVSLAADVSFPNPKGYGDRKVVLIIRQDLDDNSKEVMVAQHGAGLIHLAQRPEKGADIKETCRIEARGGHPIGTDPATAAGGAPDRIGIEKHGNSFALYVSQDGGPMRPFGPTLNLHFDGPFYVGIGFCSHMPATSDTAVVSDVVLKNASGAVR